MHPSPQAIRVLCFGDSNTWGRSGSSIERYLPDQRWTGLLQQQLGSGWEIIEEGLRSRTTNLEDADPAFEARRGDIYLRACVESQSPLDAVVLWLGTNDLKEKFGRNALEVAAQLEKMIEMIRRHATTRTVKPIQIILVAPPLVREEVLKEGTLFRGAGEKSKQLAELVKDLAERTRCHFTNLSTVVQAGEADGVHLDVLEHSKVADAIAKTLHICIT